MPKRNTANAGTIEKFTGKEQDTEGGLNLDYFGARYYDPALGRWLQADPLSEKYPAWSTYNYALNNPITAIDPDGEAVIFVNGFPPSGTVGKAYWENFASKIMSHFPGEPSYFFDGSRRLNNVNGTSSIVFPNSTDPLDAWFGLTSENPSDFSPANRIKAGYRDGKERAAEIINHLGKNDKNEIVETLKVFTHSMGAAYSRGLIKALNEYASNHRSLCKTSQFSTFLIKFCYELVPSNFIAKLTHDFSWLTALN